MKKLIFTAVSVGLILSGCGTVANHSIDSNVYSPGSAQHAQSVEYGTVEGIKAARVEGEGYIGTGMGAVVGGLAGTNVGQGRGQIVGVLAGALIGATAGKALDKKTGSQDAQEILVRRANGALMSVVQGNDQVLKVGDRVAIIQDNGTVRISRQ
jgi:outer membrane lipoprotein SlyB